MSVPSSPTRLVPDLETVRVMVAGDVFHGRLPEPTQPGRVVVYIGRGAPGLPASRYANRHRVGACRACTKTHDQASAVAAYAGDLARHLDLLTAARAELPGTDLACWCPPDALCHGDVLAAVVAGTDPRHLATRTAVQNLQ